MGQSLDLNIAFFHFAGSTLKVILHIDTRLSIIISAIIAVCYTLVGGLLSVAYTDVFQIAFIAFGLVLCRKCGCSTGSLRDLSSFLPNISSQPQPASLLIPATWPFIHSKTLYSM